MALKPGRIRLSTWLDEDSDALRDLDAICKKMGTTRGEVIRYIVIDWLESSRSSLPIPKASRPAEAIPQQLREKPVPTKTAHKVRENRAALDNLDLM